MFKKHGGFTLLEVLLVVAIIAILAGIVILAINPSKQLADTRNAQRRVDVNTILSATYQYSIDNKGTIPIVITTSSTEICSTTGAGCGALVDLGVLTANEKYITSIPLDPSGPASPHSGYFVLKTANNRITVSAPSAENGASISITK